MPQESAQSISSGTLSQIFTPTPLIYSGTSQYRPSRTLSCVPHKDISRFTQSRKSRAACLIGHDTATLETMDCLDIDIIQSSPPFFVDTMHSSCEHSSNSYHIYLMSRIKAVYPSHTPRAIQIAGDLPSTGLTQLFQNTSNTNTQPLTHNAHLGRVLQGAN